MDFYINYFPILKAVFGFSVLALGVWFYKKKLYKAMYVLAIFAGIILWFAPVKYDGTQTTTHHKNQVRQVTQKYQDVSSEKIVTHKKSLTEILREEEARSDKANQKVTDEINK